MAGAGAAGDLLFVVAAVPLQSDGYRQRGAKYPDGDFDDPADQYPHAGAAGHLLGGAGEAPQAQ